MSSLTDDSRRVLRHHTSYINKLCFSNNGQVLASASSDGSCSLFRVDDRETQILEGHQKDVTACAFNPQDDCIVATGSSDTMVRVFSGCMQGESGGSYEERCSPDIVLKGHHGAVTSVKYSHDGFRLISGSRDNTIRVWNTKKEECESILGGHTGSITEIAPSPHDYHLMLSTSTDKTMRLWNARLGKEVMRYPEHPGFVTCCDWSNGEPLVVSSCMDGAVRLYDSRTHEAVSVHEAHPGGALGVSFLGGGSVLASVGWDCCVRIWDTRSDKPLMNMTLHKAPVQCVAASPDGVTLATGSDDLTIRLWEAPRVSAISTGGDAIYEGDYRMGFPYTGKGLYKTAYGDLFEGRWLEGVGEGTIFYADGGIYKGSWKDMMRSGPGSYTHSNGQEMSCEWREDIPLSEYLKRQVVNVVSEVNKDRAEGDEATAPSYLEV